MIEIENFTLYYLDKKLLKDINLHVKSGTKFGIIGESGGGKSLLGGSLAGYFDESLMGEAKKFIVGSNEPLKMKKDELRGFRQSVAGVIMQEPNFHPYYNFGDIFYTHLKEKFAKDKGAIREIAFEKFALVGLENPHLIWHSFARQVSGGMAARIQIALNLCLNQKIFICDEITSSLDSKNAGKIVEILESVSNELVIISHDLAMIERLCDEVCVIGGGEILAHGGCDEILKEVRDGNFKV